MLHSAYNLAFIKYKKVNNYSYSLLILNALVSLLKLKLRTNNKEIQYKQLEYLKKRVL